MSPPTSRPLPLRRTRQANSRTTKRNGGDQFSFSSRLAKRDRDILGMYKPRLGPLSLGLSLAALLASFLWPRYCASREKNHRMVVLGYVPILIVAVEKWPSEFRSFSGRAIVAL
ncbi:hypothetical protein NEUTE1DRAFT_135730 [Neurospora tetrasperma FGSC 2508]|uniref:Uncharacterized protein n=1 Tax=Neurospora tetrasperma (strain FGSC 2508 / ATCC MYA-4615 / P0657) TaxID=510951 RepID=F8MGK4_NEUT8|nr:uncharacterized protein NEUTE1DRAFT_135730 [Neurospora tetrasperma FGSC 2508]EGO58626.1 hypothetical protein NEUTE1DRAFT_135730 [Neurospora tetrasperma FGSC 2508]